MDYLHKNPLKKDKNGNLKPVNSTYYSDKTDTKKLRKKALFKRKRMISENHRELGKRNIEARVNGQKLGLKKRMQLNKEREEMS